MYLSGGRGWATLQFAEIQSLTGTFEGLWTFHLQGETVKERSFLIY